MLTIFTGVSGVIGLILGVINTIFIIRKEQVRVELQIGTREFSPKISNLTDPFVSVIIINKSSFTISIDYMKVLIDYDSSEYDGGIVRESYIPPHPVLNNHKIASRTNFMVGIDPKSLDVERLIGVSLTTSCGKVITKKLSKNERKALKNKLQEQKI